MPARGTRLSIWEAVDDEGPSGRTLPGRGRLRAWRGRQTGAETDRRQWYTRTFSGTSSASPIVAGAVASIQGIRKAYGLSILNPRQMRDLLRTTGTPQAMDVRQIGPMPNLRAAIATFGILRGHLDLFVTGTDGRVMTTWWDAGSDAWAAWDTVAGGVFQQGTPVAAMAR